MVENSNQSSPPFDFAAATAKSLADAGLQQAIQRAVIPRDAKRKAAWADLPDAPALRDLAARIRQHTLDHLDYYLEQLQSSVQRNGGQVHFAADADHARRIILDIARKADCSRCIKSKSMVSEEIHLTPFLQKSGLDAVETDLGEFIAQISNDRPSHIVAPIMHKDRASIGRLFHEYFKTPYTDDPALLTRQARCFLRDRFRRADFGMTGANFLVADTGHVCVVENEGNARQSTTTPRVLVTLAGIEKVIPRLTDLSVLLKLLTRSATGNPITVYTNLFGGPRQPDERDGPFEFHLVLLDNGRSEILAGEYRETLRCIRCGSCLNACPVFRKLGGHGYGAVYSGPIGAVITPLLQGLGNFKDLPQASTLCGACFEACPVKINLPQHLVNLRRDIVAWELNSLFERTAYRLWAWSLRHPRLYRLSSALQRLFLRRRAKGTGWVQKMPPPASGWTRTRSMPAPADQSFHQLWRNRKQP